MKKILIEACLMVLLVFSTSCYAHDEKFTKINSFEDCVAAGNKVYRSFPAKCVTADGRIFIDLQAIKNQDTKESFCKDLCGDGVCQEIVCMAQGCPCAENPQSCPKDCK